MRNKQPKKKCWLFDKIITKRSNENEWDEEDYFDEFGVPMPEEVKFQKIYLIGKNLYDCFSRMIPV